MSASAVAVSAPKGPKSAGILHLRGQSPHSLEEKTVCEGHFNPAENVPKPRPLDDAQRVKGLEMPGEKPKGQKCGEIVGITACPKRVEQSFSVNTTLTGTTGHVLGVKPFFCKSPRCETCWPVWLERAAQRGAERMAAAQALFKLRDPRHWTYSPPQKEWRKRLRTEGVAAMPKLYRKAYQVIRASGMSGGLVVFHPWRCNGHGKHRYRTGTRYLAPHFHVIGFGYVQNSAKHFDATGWVVKNLDSLKCGRCGMANAMRKVCRRCGFGIGPKPARVVLRYLLDHCGINVSTGKAKDAVRAFGEVHQLRVVEEHRIEEPVRCPCGVQCWEYEPAYAGSDEPGEEREPSVLVMTRRVYARRKTAKAPPDAPGFYYSVELAPEITLQQVALDA